MSKFSRQSKLSPRDSEQLFVEFCRYLSELHTPEEIAKAFGDLLSKPEVIMVAKRLKIAVLLMSGMKYADIRGRLRTSQPTIARVNLWLQESGEGFRLLYERGRKYRKKPVQTHVWGSEWRRIKRKYPLYSWPQVLIEELVDGASTRQRQKITTTLRVLERKGALSKDLISFRRYIETGTFSKSKLKVT